MTRKERLRDERDCIYSGCFFRPVAFERADLRLHRPFLRRLHDSLRRSEFVLYRSQYVHILRQLPADGRPILYPGGRADGGRRSIEAAGGPGRLPSWPLHWRLRHRDRGVLCVLRRHLWFCSRHCGSHWLHHGPHYGGTRL